MNKLKKYIIIASMIFAAGMATGCSSFLEEEPNKAGSAYIYHMDQLYELTGSPDLYMFGSVSYMAYGITGSYMYEEYYMTDAIETSPEMFYIGYGGANSSYDYYCLDKDTWLEDQYGMSQTWTPCWERIYRFNTVLENIDKVQQSTQAIHDQVAGESYFGRAYYHFILLYQYCLWNENEPGIGYRDGTAPGQIPGRETVKYTLDKIYADLDKAEELLTKSGRSTFEKATNFRPTVPTVKAFRARVDLYRGKYDSALQNANAALSAHNTLVNFQNDPTYTLVDYQDFYLLDKTNTKIEKTIKGRVPYSLWMLNLQPVSVYDEMYLTSMTKMPTHLSSSKYINLFDKENDARFIYFYNNYYPWFYTSNLLETKEIDGTVTSPCISYENRQWLEEESGNSYMRFYGNGSTGILGMTTAEMYLIKAECLARSGKTSEAAEALKTLRETRFTTKAAADNIGGSVQEVLDERYREMTSLWRFFDIKRLNGAENANISLKRKILTDQTDINSVTEITVGPDDGRWALPIYKNEAANMGWAQNKGWE